MGDNTNPDLGADFQSALKPTIASKVRETLENIDFLFVGDLHTDDTQLEFVARPDVMRAFADGNVTVLDLEILPPELVYIAELYHNGEISKKTMEYFVADVYATSNHKEDNTEVMKNAASIIDQAKTYDIQITSSNHSYPKYSEDEFAIKTEYENAMIDYQARYFDKREITGMSEADKITHFKLSEREFREENPEIVARKNSIPTMQKERVTRLAATLSTAFVDSLNDIPEEISEEASDFIARMEEQGEFVTDDFKALSDGAQGLVQKVYDKAEMKARFDNDEHVAARMEESRGAGKIVAVWGAIHFDRNSAPGSTSKPDIDSVLGEERTATLRVMKDQGKFEETLTEEYNKVQALYKFDLSDTPNVTIDLSKGAWVDRDGGVTEINTAIPVSDQPAEEIIPPASLQEQDHPAKAIIGGLGQ